MRADGQVFAFDVVGAVALYAVYCFRDYKFINIQPIGKYLFAIGQQPRTCGITLFRFFLFRLPALKSTTCLLALSMA